jgi:serine/threonine protein kinase
MGTVIGLGGWSTVSLCIDRKTGEKVAVKRLHSDIFDLEHFIREIEILIGLNHPCVLRIIGWSPPSGRTPPQIYTEYAESGSLRKVLTHISRGEVPRFWTPTGKGILICGIVLGMRFVHSKGYIHRDLTPNNILLNGRGEALIADFGLSKPESDNATMSCEPGTVWYSALELFCEGVTYTAKIDVFSFGLVLYEILAGKAVFPSSMPPFEVIRALRGHAMPEILPFCDANMQALIQRCWSPDPNARPSFDEILSEFEKASFCIVPGADPSLISAYVCFVKEWEDRMAHTQSDGGTNAAG